jgi:Histidine kinase
MFWKSIFLCFLFYFTTNYILAQQKKIDSLEKVLANYKKEDTVKAELLNNIGALSIYTNPKKALVNAKLLGILGEKLNHNHSILGSMELEAAYYLINLKLDSAVIIYNKIKKFGLDKNFNEPIFIANSNLANIYLMRGKPKEAILLYKEGIAHAEKHNYKLINPKGRLLVNLANAYNATGDRVSALKSALECLEFSSKTGDLNDISAANYLIGSIYGITGQFKEALLYHQGYSGIQLQLNNWSNACSGLIAVANDYTQLNKTDSAINYWDKASKIAKEHNLIALENKIAVNLTNLNKVQLKDDEEIEKLLALKKYYEENALQQDLGQVLCKIAIGYTKVSTTYLSKNRLTKSEVNKISEKFLLLAMEIADISNNYSLKEEVLRSTSAYYEMQQNYVSAYDVYKKYIVLRDSAINESQQVEISKLSMQYNFNKKEDSLKLEQANTNNKLLLEQYLNKTQQQNILLQKNELLLNKKTLISNNQELNLLNKDKELQHLAFLKTQADLQTEQFLKNENEKQLTIVQKDKLLANEKVKNISQENEFNKLKRRELLTYSIVGLIGLLLIGLFLMDRNRNKQAKLKLELAGEKAEQQIKDAEFQKSIADISLSALRSQMNPHFIFNCLNSIKLYTTQNNNEAAAIYLTKFSKLIRMALENSRSEAVTLQNEIESLELYIQMEAMRFKDKLKYTLTIEKNVDIDFIEIPPMLLQPYVENAIWHGLMHKEDGGNIDIQISNVENENALVITIKDDGVGREKAALLKSKIAVKHKSFGTKVTSERLALINKLYKTEASVITSDVIKNNIVAGTLVTIKIPFA